ncbi:ABC transporter permease, partial [Achromobacter xylosoxidans]
MVERRPWLDILAHVILLCGVAMVAFPLYVTFVASTQTAQEVASAPMSLIPGPHFVDNYMQALFGGSSGGSSGAPVGRMMYVSLIMALAISIGKIAISLLSAFAVVYFRFPGRMFFFWMIFVTLMLPVEVRIAPTYKVVADLGL